MLFADANVAVVCCCRLYVDGFVGCCCLRLSTFAMGLIVVDVCSFIFCLPGDVIRCCLLFTVVRV